MISNHILTTLIATLTLIILVSSCRTEPKENTTAKVGEAPKSLQMRLSLEPDGLSPILSRRGETRKVYRHLLSQLLEVEPVSSKFLPKLATSLPKEETLENGDQKFTFTLHDNAQWSDGKPLTTKDIIFSYKMLKHPVVKTRYEPIADLVNNITIHSDTEVSFIAGECHTSLMTSISEMFIYPEHIFDPEGVMRDIPFADFLDKDKIASLAKANPALSKVGERFMDPEYFRDPAKFVTSNAYNFVEWITGQRVVIRKNPNWWGKEIDSPLFKQQAEEIVFQIIPDNNTALTQLINGEIDAISQVPPILFEEYKDNPNIVAKTSPAYQIVWLNLNMSNDILSDRIVRKALAYSLDEKSILKNALNSNANLVTGPFMPGTNEYNDKVEVPRLDIDKAQQMLSAAGWEDSDQDGIVDKIINGKKTDLSLELIHSSKSTTGPVIGELFKSSARQAGIDIKITPKDSKITRQEVNSGNFDIYLTGTGFGPGLYDPTGRWHTKSFPPNGLNYSKFGNAETDAMIDQMRSMCDNPKERTDLYHRLHAYIAQEQPVIFLYNPESLFLINKEFDNIIVSPNGPGLFEEFLTLK